MKTMTRMMIAAALLGGTMLIGGVQAQNAPRPTPTPDATAHWEARRPERPERPARPERPDAPRGERPGEEAGGPAPMMRALARVQAEVARVAMQEEELRGRAAQATREDLPAERRERLARMQVLRTELLELEKAELMVEVRERLADMRTRLEGSERRELPALAFLGERLDDLEKASTDFDSFRLALRQMRHGAANEGWLMPHDPAGAAGAGMMGQDGAPGQRGPRAGGPPDAPRGPQSPAANPEVRAQRLNREIEALEQRIKRLSEELAIMGSEIRRQEPVMVVE